MIIAVLASLALSALTRFATPTVTHTVYETPQIQQFKSVTFAEPAVNIAPVIQSTPTPESDNK